MTNKCMKKCLQQGIKRNISNIVFCVLLNTAHIPLFAQPAFLRPDDEDFRIIPPPVEVISLGIGTFAVAKGSVNTTTSLSNTLTSSPGLYFNRTFTDKGSSATTLRGIDVRPVIDYGMTLSAPTLFTLFGRNWGLSVDVYFASYRYVTNYFVDNILEESLRAEFRTRNQALNGGTTPELLNAFSDEYFPRFVTTFRTLNVAPMLNINGFLLGANIGIPMPFMTSTLTTPSSRILPLSGAQLPFDASAMQTIVEPRIGLTAPLVSTRSGTLNFLASLGWMLPTQSPLRSQSLIQSPNILIEDAVRRWQPTVMTLTTPPTNPLARPLDELAITPLSLSLGFSYIFTFGNGALIDEFEREAYSTDSIRAYYATITRKVDSLRAISTRLADSMANTVIASTRLRDSLNKLLQARTLDSTSKAQEKRLFAERERREAMEAEKQALEATKRDLEAQKRELESKNKQKDKEIARKVRELAEKQRLVEEKQRQIEEKQRVIEETKKRVFEAKLGAIVGVNEDGSETAENPVIRVEEFAAQYAKILVPRVFFDKGSTVIPARYKQINAADRTSYQAPKNANEKSTLLHAQLLNIIGKRLQENASAQLTLTGFKRDDEADPKLALKRAEAIASYFIDRWKIPSSRIIRESGRNDALQPSDQSGKAISVLISADNASITAPYTLSDVTRTATPSKIAIGLDITTGAGLKQWQLEIRQLINNEDELLTDTSGSKVVPRFIWNLGEDALSVPRSTSPVNIRLEAFDVKNAKAPESPIKDLNVEQITVAAKKASNKPDKTVFFYDVVFDASVTNWAGQQNLLLSEIKSRLTADSKVQITVFNPTGVSGNAADIAQMLGIEANAAKLLNSSTKLYPAQNNESAAYNNCIRIRIETPNK